MTSRDFCYWLQGFFEINKAGDGRERIINIIQQELIQNHLSMVFVHEIDPSYGDKKEQDKLNAIHNMEGAELYENKPNDWQPHWEFSSFHGWYDPQYGIPRC